MLGGIDFGCLMNFDCNICIWVFGGNLPGLVALVLAACCILFVGDVLDWFGTLMVGVVVGRDFVWISGGMCFIVFCGVLKMVVAELKVLEACWGSVVVTC